MVERGAGGGEEKLMVGSILVVRAALHGRSSIFAYRTANRSDGHRGGIAYT